MAAGHDDPVKIFRVVNSCVWISWMPCRQLAYARPKRVGQQQICGQRRAEEPDLWTTSPLVETHVHVRFERDTSVATRAE